MAAGFFIVQPGGHTATRKFTDIEVIPNQKLLTAIAKAQNPDDASEKLSSDDLLKLLPDDQLELFNQIEICQRSLRLYYGLEIGQDTPNNAFFDYLHQLYQIAKSGLYGPVAYTNLALSQLTIWKQDLVDREATSVKNRYIQKLGITTGILGLPILLLSILFQTRLNLDIYHLLPNFKQFDAGVILSSWPGTMLGIWISFSIRKTKLTFNDLTVIENDQLSPINRSLVIGSIALVFILMFYTKIFELSVGGFSTVSIGHYPLQTFIIGIFLGLSEQYIGKSLMTKVTEYFKQP